MSVSYTHLDVYKRQLQDHIRRLVKRLEGGVPEPARFSGIDVARSCFCSMQGRVGRAYVDLAFDTIVELARAIR